MKHEIFAKTQPKMLSIKHTRGWIML